MMTTTTIMMTIKNLIPRASFSVPYHCCGRVSRGVFTGVDLSKIVGGHWNTGGQKVVKSDKCIGVSQLLGARARAAPHKSTPMGLFVYSPIKRYWSWSWRLWWWWCQRSNIDGRNVNNIDSCFYVVDHRLSSSDRWVDWLSSVDDRLLIDRRSINAVCLDVFLWVFVSRDGQTNGWTRPRRLTEAQT